MQANMVQAYCASRSTCISDDTGRCWKCRCNLSISVSKTVDVRHACCAYRQCSAYICCRSLLLQNLPVLQWSQRNEARRLVTLIDTLYDMRCQLECSAAGKPDQVPDTKLSKHVAVHFLFCCLVTSFKGMWLAPHIGSPSTRSPIYAPLFIPCLHPAISSFAVGFV